MSKDKKEEKPKPESLSLPGYEYETILSWQPKMYSKIEQTLICDGTAERREANRQAIMEAQDLFNFAERMVEEGRGAKKATPLEYETEKPSLEPRQKTLEPEETKEEGGKYEGRICPVCQDANRRVIYVEGDKQVVIDKTGKEGRAAMVYRHPEETGVYEAKNRRTGEPYKAFWSCELSREKMPDSEDAWCKFTKHAKIDTDWP